MQNDKPTQSTPPQSVESEQQVVCDDHLMPGLVPRIVNTFMTPGAHLTTRGVARRREVRESAVNTALFRHLLGEINELRDIVGRKGPASETSVRQFIRRQA